MSRYATPEFHEFESALIKYIHWSYDQTGDDGDEWIPVNWILIVEAENMSDGNLVRYSNECRANTAKRYGLLEVGRKITDDGWDES